MNIHIYSCFWQRDSLFVWLYHFSLNAFMLENLYYIAKRRAFPPPHPKHFLYDIHRGKGMNTLQIFAQQILTFYVKCFVH